MFFLVLKRRNVAIFRFVFGFSLVVKMTRNRFEMWMHLFCFTGKNLSTQLTDRNSNQNRLLFDWNPLSIQCAECDYFNFFPFWNENQEKKSFKRFCNWWRIYIQQWTKLFSCENCLLFVRFFLLLFVLCIEFYFIKMFERRIFSHACLQSLL